jgi:predicted transcriptional regulator
MPMTSRLTIRWTDQEYARLKRIADDREVSVSSVIRDGTGEYVERVRWLDAHTKADKADFAE